MLNRLSIMLLASCLSLPMLGATASAESPINNTKRFNFGSGSSAQSGNGLWAKREKQRERSTNRSRGFDFFRATNGFFASDEDQRQFDAEVRSRQKPRQRVRLSDNDGPDAASTGETYYTYKADSLENVARASLEQPKPPAPIFATEAGASVHAADFLETISLKDKVAQAIFTAIKDGSSNVKVARDAAPKLIDFYVKRAFEPVWLKDGKPTSDAVAIYKVLQNADQEGLDPTHYQVQEVALAGGIDSLSSDPDALARFDLQMSAMALRYSAHASGGLVNPNKISGYHDLAPPKVAPADALASLVNHSAPADWLMGLHPKLPAYKAMKQELIKLGAGQQDEEIIVIPEGGMLKLGIEDPRVLILRKRLEQLDFLKNKEELASSETQASDAPLFGSESSVLTTKTQSEIMNEADVKALQAFQKSVGLNPDGLAGRNTINALNGKKKLNRNEQLALNMERMRWLPRDLGERYILVNQAAYEMKIINKGATEWQTRVIVGKLTNQTYFFSDQMSRVEFNPYWGIPQSIIKGEYLRKLQSNPGYLDQRGYETIRNGKIVSSSAVDWWNYKGNIGVRQKPGSNNALGEVKFMFPNKHAIYLHDTPKRSLFENENRAFSHGCVRVQNPRDLATHILGWSSEKVAATIASGKNTPVQMDKKLPVHLTYFTAWTDEAGNISYYTDTYKRNTYLSKALAAERAAM